jgi:hypothetical protein
LLFGALAVQLGKVLRSDLIKAALAWADRAEGSLSSTLVDQGKLSPSDRDMIDGMVRGALETHRGDEDAPLATFGGNLLNTGLITNLPQGACVEVKCVAAAAGSRRPTPAPLPRNAPP